MIPIAVVSGGPSLEHEISLKSGAEIAKHLDRGRYEAVPVVIGRNQRWSIHGGESLDPAQAVLALRALHIDTCFLALHGPYGEDGRVQAFLETCGLRFTGSGPRGTAIAGVEVRARAREYGLGPTTRRR